MVLYVSSVKRNFFGGFVMGKVIYPDKLMNFDSDNVGTCLRCKERVNSFETRLIQHPQCSYAIEVCGQCYHNYIIQNDSFFKELI